MKKLLLLIISMGLISSMHISWSSNRCRIECEEEYKRCVDSVKKAAGSNYFKCIDERVECLDNCKRMLD